MNWFTIAAFNARRAVARRKTLVLAVLAATPPAFVVVVRRFAPPQALDSFFETIPLFYLAFLCQILPLFFAASAVRDAIEDRTASFVLTTPTSRAAFVFGAWLGMLPPLLVLTAASAACTFATWRAGAGEVFGGDDVAACGRLIAVSSYGVVVYTGLFTWLGLVVKWPTVVGVLYYGVAELFLGFIPGAPRRLALSSCFEALLGPPFRTRAALMAEAQAGLDTPLSPTTAWLAPLATAAIVAVLLVFRARSRDFVDEAPTTR